MIRTFHPVGQGAFYTEIFDNFIMVYDCGSDNNIPLIEAEIRNTFEENQTIHAVYISHLHDDHVNGLEYLMKYCNVKKIFLPFIHDKLSIYINYAIRGVAISPFIQSLIDFDLTKQSNFGETQIVVVPEVEEDSQSEITGEALNFDSIVGELPRNSKIALPTKKEWVFIPFNFRNNVRSTELARKLTSKGLLFNSISEFYRLWEDLVKREQIKAVYESIPGSLNANSMTLYSGPELDSTNNIISTISHTYHVNPVKCISHLKAGLYFGDYEAKGSRKWQQFINHYMNYWHLVGIVQIPHHGSHNNYNREINRLRPKISVLSAGNYNIHGHPHHSTIMNILKDGGCPKLVTEDASSKLFFYVNVI